jgi:hypothetical protein
MNAANRDADRFDSMNGSDFRSDIGSDGAAHHDPFRTVRRIAVNIATAGLMRLQPNGIG